MFLKYSKVVHVKRNIKISVLVVFILIFGVLVVGTVDGAIPELIFDQISYNYTAYASIPALTNDTGSLGGIYDIQGKGTKFKFDIIMPGAENFEDPLCYTKDGLKGEGKIENIKINYKTILSLLNRDFKTAMFETPFTGKYNMSCAAWTGYGNFTNNGISFPGTFKIDGPDTDFEGTFQLTQENNRIVIKSDYILYPHGQKSPENIKHINQTYYM